MGKYEQIAIDLLEAAFGDRFARDDSRIFSFGSDTGTGEVDGVIDGKVAAEIGVGSPKQIRASTLDLALHPYAGKLLVLVDTPGHSTERSAGQARAILEELGCGGVVFRVEEGRGREEMVGELVDEYGVTERNVVWTVDGR